MIQYKFKSAQFKAEQMIMSINNNNDSITIIKDISLKYFENLMLQVGEKYITTYYNSGSDYREMKSGKVKIEKNDNGNYNIYFDNKHLRVNIFYILMTEEQLYKVLYHLYYDFE